MKNNNFSLLRTGQLIRFYWMNEHKLWLWLYLGLAALLVFKETLANVVFHLGGPGWDVLLTGLFLCIGASRLFAMLISKRGAIDFLSLPAGNAEKFISRVIYGTLGLVLTAALASLTAGCICFLFIWMMESLVGNPFPTDALRYYLGPDFRFLGGPFEADMGAQAIFQGLSFVIAIWALLLSLFTWAGLQARRYGWVVGVCLVLACILIAELAQQIFGFAPEKARPYILAIPLLAPVFYWLAYRAFCHAKIANHKPLGL